MAGWGGSGKLPKSFDKRARFGGVFGLTVDSNKQSATEHCDRKLMLSQGLNMNFSLAGSDNPL